MRGIECARSADEPEVIVVAMIAFGKVLFGFVENSPSEVEEHHLRPGDRPVLIMAPKRRHARLIRARGRGLERALADGWPHKRALGRVRDGLSEPNQIL